MVNPGQFMISGLLQAEQMQAAAAVPYSSRILYFLFQIKCLGVQGTPGLRGRCDSGEKLAGLGKKWENVYGLRDNTFCEGTRWNFPVG